MAGIIYITEQMISFTEMRIIFAYKHLEINIKRLLRLAYENVDVKMLSNWENLKNFLKSKSIDVTNLSGYSEVNELRLVNNQVKHSDVLKKEVKLIPEFVGSDSIQLDPLERFYNRVKQTPLAFLKSLTGAVYRNLYS